jgi:hypothetical protein
MNDGEMGGIDQRNNKGNLRIAPVIFGIGEHSEISISESFLCSSDYFLIKD